jgi:UDP-N-acetylglucosamine 2-epimerase (non-hydrolysing)
LNKLKEAIVKIESGSWKKGRRPELWDGNTAKRIVEALLKL